MIYSVDIKDKTILLKDDCEETTFKNWGLVENSVENFICEHPEILFEEEENCILVGRHAVDEARGINDLMAINGDGDLILIELKRDKQDIKNRAEQLEFQAIRYCASLAKIKNPEELVSSSYAKYLEKFEPNYQDDLIPYERARKQLNEFLISNKCEDHFNEKQKIILVASDYDETTLSACAWLIKNGVDIRLVKITPIEISDKKELSVSVIMPTKDESEYYVGLVKRDATRSNKTNATRTNKPRMKQLMEWGIISIGSKLFIKGYQSQIAIVKDDKTVIYNGKEMSFNKWGCEVTSWSAICIYEFAIEVGKTETLDELRTKKMLELEEQNSLK